MLIQVSEDITLRSLETSDAEDIFRTIDSQREYLGRWLPFIEYTTSVDDSRAFVNATINTTPERFEQVFTIRKDDAFAGLIGFKSTDRDNRKTEIGYWLSEPFQHQGIVSRSVKTLCGYAFSELNINRIQIRCAAGNTPSRKIPERLGFKFEGAERDGELFPDGSFADINVYSLLKTEFQGL